MEEKNRTATKKQKTKKMKTKKMKTTKNSIKSTIKLH